MSSKPGLMSLSRELRANINDFIFPCEGRIRLVAIRNFDATDRTWHIYCGPEELSWDKCAKQNDALSALAALRLTSTKLRDEADADFFLRNKFDLMMRERSTIHTDPNRALTELHIGMLRNIDMYTVTLLQRAQTIDWSILEFDDDLLRDGRWIGTEVERGGLTLLTKVVEDYACAIASTSRIWAREAMVRGEVVWCDFTLQRLLDKMLWCGSITLPFGPRDYAT